MLKVLISLFLLGLSFGAGPCIASCGPFLISYVAGTHKNVQRSALTYILFSFSRIFVYLALGLSVFFFRQVIVAYHLGNFSRYIFIFGGLFIVGTGLLIAFRQNSSHKLCQRLDSKTTPLLFGLLMGILPCAPLISVISYIGLVARTGLSSLIYSLVFGLGTALSPLVLLVGSAGLIPRLITNKRFYRIFNLICGAIIVFLGLQLIRKAF